MAKDIIKTDFKADSDSDRVSVNASESIYDSNNNLIIK